jgi:predicted CopG family antitoxin
MQISYRNISKRKELEQMKSKKNKRGHRLVPRHKFVTIAAYQNDYEFLCGMVNEEIRSFAQVIRQLVNREKTRLQYEMQNASETPSAMQSAG